MSERNDGGPAFPLRGGMLQGLNDQYWIDPSPGMSLRDWFAGQALTGLLAYPEAHLCCGTAKKGAACAYEIADAMLAERAARSTQEEE